VVVDRHKDQIVNVHRVLPVSERASCDRVPGHTERVLRRIRKA
jgi:hypothetical protein